MSHFKVGDRLAAAHRCEHGVSTVVRRTERGVEASFLTAEPTADSQELVKFGRDDDGSVVVKEVIAFTARSRPATNAYRSGWDSVFGKKAQAN